MVIEQCPQCGYEPIQHEVICTIPPVSVKRCPKCGWRHEKRDTLHDKRKGEHRMTNMEALRICDKKTVESILVAFASGAVSARWIDPTYNLLVYADQYLSAECTLSQVSKNHGRLIDADKLKQHYAWWGEDSEQKKLFDQIIDLQPTVAEQDE